MKRPEGVEKNPITNANVKGGRKKKQKINKFVPEDMIKQFHRDLSQSSIQNVSAQMDFSKMPNGEIAENLG